MVENRYYSGQGRLNCSDKDREGNPVGGFYFLGDVSELLFKMETKTIQHRENYTGGTHTDRVLESERTATFAFKIDNFIKENLELTFFGKSQTKTSDVVSEERHIAPPQGKHFFLNHIKIDPSVVPSIVIDPDGAATNASAGQDYKVNIKTGKVTILKGGAIARGDELSVSYRYFSSNETQSGKAPSLDKVLIFEGLNRSEDNKLVIVKVVNARLKPVADWELVSERFAELQIEGTAQWEQGRVLEIYEPIPPDQFSSGGVVVGSSTTLEIFDITETSNGGVAVNGDSIDEINSIFFDNIAIIDNTSTWGNTNV